MDKAQKINLTQFNRLPSGTLKHCYMVQTSMLCLQHTRLEFGDFLYQRLSLSLMNQYWLIFCVAKCVAVCMFCFLVLFHYHNVSCCSVLCNLTTWAFDCSLYEDLTTALHSSVSAAACCHMHSVPEVIKSWQDCRTQLCKSQILCLKYFINFPSHSS